MPKKADTKIHLRNYMFLPDIPEDKDAKTYRERIDPQLVEFEEFWSNPKYEKYRVGKSRREWQMEKQKAALESAYDGITVEVTDKRIS